MSKAIGAARLSSENSRGQVAPPRSPQPKIPMCLSPTINLTHRSCQRQSNTPKRPLRDQRFSSCSSLTSHPDRRATARELTKLGHQVRLMPPAYVKPYVKRGKTDAADAEAICEAVQRPTMRFVPVKSGEQQAALALHRTRDLLVKQRTQLVNRSEEHTSELQSLIRISYAVLCVKKKK